MSSAKYIGRIGALAVTLGVGFAVTVAPGNASAESAIPPPDPPRTALIMGGTTIPKPDDYLVKLFMNQFIVPTHPNETIDPPVAVTTPQEWWPVTGFARLIGLVVGPPSVWGPGGAGWPNVPLWKLSGLFDVTIGQSLQAGVVDLEAAMAANPDVPLVIFGVSQGAVVADMERRRLAEQYPDKSKAPDIDFVLLAGGNLPNGGFLARFPGLYIPIVDLPFNGPAPTDTGFDTVMINKEYDGLGDFPLYPLNLVSTANALLGGPLCYVHCYAFDLSLPAVNPTESPAYQGKYGDTSYYFFENPDLPLFGPLRTVGVPEPVIDVFEPFFRVIVDTGYDRNIPLWEPTPARLIPRINPATLAADLGDAIGEGIDNARALVGAPASLRSRPTVDIADQTAAVEQDVAVHDDLGARQRKVGPDLAPGDLINQTVGAVKSVIGNGRTHVRSSNADIGDPPAITDRPARKTPVRDAIVKARSDIKKAVTEVSDSIKKALGGGKDDDDGEGGEEAAG